MQIKRVIGTSFLALTLIYSGRMEAQTESRFPIKSSSVWRINYEYMCSTGEFTHQSGDMEYKYFIEGDTMINNTSYMKLYKSGILYLDSPVTFEHDYVGAIRDSANFVKFIEPTEDHETVLYNFNAGVGEVITTSEGIDYLVGNIELLNDGRKKFTVDVITVHCGSSNTVIEGIGWLGGLLEGNACFAHPGIRGSYLLCYTEDDNEKYFTDMELRCGKPISCDVQIGVGEHRQPDFKHIKINYLPGGNFEIQPINNDMNTSFQIMMYSLEGRTVFTAKAKLPFAVNTMGLQGGVYMIKVSDNHTDYTGKVVIP